MLLPAFWSGLPLVLGVAGALFGYAGRNAASGARLSIAAFLVGVLSSIGYVTIYVIDFMGQSAIGSLDPLPGFARSADRTAS